MICIRLEVHTTKYGRKEQNAYFSKCQATYDLTYVDKNSLLFCFLEMALEYIYVDWKNKTHLVVSQHHGLCPFFVPFFSAVFILENQSLVLQQKQDIARHLKILLFTGLLHLVAQQH